MKAPVLNIPLRELVAVSFGVIGLFAEVFVAGVIIENFHRTPVFDARLCLVIATLFFGGSALALLPFLYRGKEWARGFAALSLSLIAVTVLALVAVAIFYRHRELADYTVTFAFGISVFVASVAGVLVLLNRKLADEMFPPTLADKEEPNPITTAQRASRVAD